MTEHYAVVGNPVAHSVSPQIHAEFARQTGQDISYTAILAPFDGFKATVFKFRDGGGKGVNVTLPFKEEAFRLSTKPTVRADAARTVNTLSFGNGDIIGDNTDGVGLITDLKRNLKFELRSKRILLMGAGGAARGVLPPILLEEPDSLTIVNRTIVRALELKNRLHDVAASNALGKRATDFKVSDYAQLTGSRFDLVINATSAGLSNEMPPLTGGIFASGALAYDLVYGKSTPFLKFAREHGAAHVADGIGMLVEQAAESFFIWRGVRPETASVIAILRAQGKQ